MASMSFPISEMGGVNHVAWVKGKGKLPALLRAVMWQQKSGRPARQPSRSLIGPS
ncbi:hypothetical protein BDQ94DRAFT_152395 [Aspergillus welwitschiae]|uniref:Uncharacterized protein n=1 Tax=Aspergillus welwitschiae TaxID=1341132 RepID=A0A3F3PMS9_9EURO|nr:hypothetical protein BDQ94DRAFT_152395 [Aspergillus welwitschiae]RDH28250.1 hypothetical protein BDQ94DRAFT_152395 [Aspergillus welwitschiae]